MWQEFISGLLGYGPTVQNLSLSLTEAKDSRRIIKYILFISSEKRFYKLKDHILNATVF